MGEPLTAVLTGPAQEKTEEKVGVPNQCLSGEDQLTVSFPMSPAMRQAGDGLTCQAMTVLCVLAEEEIEEMVPAQMDAELAGQVGIEEVSQDDDGWGEQRLTAPSGLMEARLDVTAKLYQPDPV